MLLIVLCPRQDGVWVLCVCLCVCVCVCGCYMCVCVCLRPCVFVLAYIERTLLEDTVKTLNSYYAEAEKMGGQSYMEGCLACATAYLIFLCMETRYEKMLKKISGYIQEQNEKIYAPRGLLLTDPIERGMRIEVSVFEDRGSSGSSHSSSVSSGGSSQR
uniref:Golgin subfamily A member 7/ERF4 domain-containing protein n=1 Tax=Hucho hucho TaxID=62062 RepID=A0A4W5J969_9TELE